jgi:hypothetical protein
MKPLFARVLGDAAFSTLPHRVQALHRATGTRTYAGSAQVEAGSSWLARLCARATALPSRALIVPVEVEITCDAGGERWTRRFGAHRMPSRFWLAGGLLYERIGAATFAFALHVEAGSLHWRVRHVRVLGVPLPAALFGGVRAREFEADGRYGFDVQASLPLAGLLVRYRGWLDV